MSTATVDRQVQQFRDNFRVVREEVSRVIVGNDDNIVGIMTCLLARGHVLLEGIPGIGKTKLVQTLADVLHLKFARIQFTPDLMPGDIIGTHHRARGRRRQEAPGVPARSDLRQPGAGRRDQPRHAQDPVGAARGDAGEQRVGGRTDPSARAAVLRAGHHEPAGDGGHLPAAGGPARPLLLQAAPGLPHRGRAARDHRSHHQAAGAARGPRAGPGRGAGDARDRAQRAGGAARAAVRHRPDARHAPGNRAPPPRWSSASCASAPARAAPRR